MLARGSHLRRGEQLLRTVQPLARSGMRALPVACRAIEDRRPRKMTLNSEEVMRKPGITFDPASPGETLKHLHPLPEERPLEELLHLPLATRDRGLFRILPQEQPTKNRRRRQHSAPVGRLALLRELKMWRMSRLSRTRTTLQHARTRTHTCSTRMSHLLKTSQRSPLMMLVHLLPRIHLLAPKGKHGRAPPTTARVVRRLVCSMTTRVSDALPVLKPPLDLKICQVHSPMECRGLLALYQVPAMMEVRKIPPS